jgi:hypothetical protein
VQALGGRVQVTGFADLQAVRKRLRQRDGVAPWVVAAVEDAPENTALIRTGAELTDTLQTARAPGSGPATPATVVIWLPLAPDPASMGPVDAVFAPNNVPLATASTIADASRPHQRLAALADRALTSLLRVTP